MNYSNTTKQIINDLSNECPKVPVIESSDEKFRSSLKIFPDTKLKTIIDLIVLLKQPDYFNKLLILDSELDRRILLTTSNERLIQYKK